MPSLTPSQKPSASQQGSSRSKRTKSERAARRSGSTPKGSTSQGQTAPRTLTRGEVILWSLVSGLLLYAAFPPLALWPLAWVAAAGWLVIVAAEKLPKGAYGWIYLTAVVHWLLLVWGVGHAHWATRAFGWPALSLYLAVYIPAFVALSRLAVHRYRVPLPWAGAIVWTALELFRGHFATGLALALIGHSQYQWLGVIQIADVVGGYGLGFLLLLFAGSLTQVAIARRWLARLHSRQIFPRQVWLPHAVAASLLIAATLVYGYARLASLTAAEAASAEGPKSRIALVQSSIDTSFEDSTGSQRTFDQNFELTDRWIGSRQAEDLPSADLIVWPESSMGPYYWTERTEDFAPVPEMAAQVADYHQQIDRHREYVQQLVEALSAQRWQTPLLLGTGTVVHGNAKMEHYNSALYADATGQIAQRYDKNHPVMFGEYVPGGDWFPQLYQLLPTDGGLTPGQRPIAIAAGPITAAPNICFENTVPHLIRRQIRALAAEGSPPDVLITLTNDGWFWGSSILDMHLMCGQFRAIENRRPMLIAANTGISAEIAPTGEIRQAGPRRGTAVLLAEIGQNRHFSLYTLAGDWFAALCLTATLGMLVLQFTGLRGRTKS